MAAKIPDILARYAARPRRTRRSAAVAHYTKYALAAPAVIFILIGIIYPTAYLFDNSLQAWRLTRLDLGRRFIGLENYAQLPTDDRFTSSLWISTYFTVIATSVQTVLGLVLALALNRNVPGEGVVRALILVPWLTAPFVSGFNFRFMFAPNLGVISQILDFLGLLKASESAILGRPTSAMVALILVHVWSGVPGTVLLLTAGLKSIPEELYEAASVDGASATQKFRFITLPLLRYVLLISTFLTTLFFIKAFDMIFVMTGGGPGVSTEVLALYQYRVGIRTLDMGYGSTIAVVQLVIALIVSIIFAWFMFRRRDS